MITNAAQHTDDWYKARLGYFTGSEIGNLFVNGKGGQMFGETALSYINKVAEERMINPQVLEDEYLFGQYKDIYYASSKAMDWGTEQEQYARIKYGKETHYHVIEVGSIRHKTISHFASSPDGYIDDDKDGKGCLEIKCLSGGNYMKYIGMKGNDDLRRINPKYFYQCEAHMACTDSSWCDFAIYNPFMVVPILITRIKPDSEVFDELAKRIAAADDIIDGKLKEIIK